MSAHVSSSKAKKFSIKEFRIEEISRSCTWLVLAAPESGKSTFIRNVVYYNMWRYAHGLVFTGSERDKKEWEYTTKPLYVRSGWDPKTEEGHINKQRLCQRENGEGYEGNCSYNIIDDVLNEQGHWKSNIIKYLVSKGTQHLDQLCMITSQYIMNLPVEFRTGCRYYAIGGLWSPENKKKIFRVLPVSFGGKTEAENFSIFSDLVDKACSTKYRFLIIQTGTGSIDPSDYIFFYDVKKMDKFEAASKEAIQWNKDRYNTEYVDNEKLKFVKD